jgi:hypothetical protein
MFELEIKNKCIVELYDNHLQLLKSGTITGYKDKQGYIIIDGSVLFNTRHIAKIKVHSDNMVLNRIAQR